LTAETLERPARKVMPRKEPQQARSIERVTLILDATATVMRRDGVSAVTTAAIAREAQIPVGSVYQYFPNKQAIFLALYSAYLDDIRACIRGFQARVGEFTSARDYFGALGGEIKALEVRGNLTNEISHAIRLFPDLAAEDDRHAQETARLLAETFKLLGSPLDIDTLTRLGRFMYSSNEGYWLYRNGCKTAAERAEGDVWSTKAFLAIVEIANCQKPGKA